MLSTTEHWYYLHTNGDLIHRTSKPEIEPGGFVHRVWQIKPEHRETAYFLLVEAAVLGARMSRVLELAKKWEADGEDGLVFCKRMGFLCNPVVTEAGAGYEVRHQDDTPEMKTGVGSSPLLALISYTRHSELAQQALPA